MKNEFVFPFPAYTYANGEIHPGVGGMYLRDYFATAALSVVNIYYPLGTALGSANLDRYTSLCYKVADAMMKAREQ